MKRPIVIDESRTTSGRTVVAEPLVCETDELELARGPAEAMADAIADGIGAIGQDAARATVARRRRDGITDTRLFNATGRLRNNIRAAAAGDGYVVTIPVDRELEAPGMAERLAELVPAIVDPTSAPDVKRALAKADAMTAQVGKRGSR